MESWGIGGGSLFRPGNFEKIAFGPKAKGPPSGFEIAFFVGFGGRPYY